MQESSREERGAAPHSQTPPRPLCGKGMQLRVKSSIRPFLLLLRMRLRWR